MLFLKGFRNIVKVINTMGMSDVRELRLKKKIIIFRRQLNHCTQQRVDQFTQTKFKGGVASS